LLRRQLSDPRAIHDALRERRSLRLVLRRAGPLAPESEALLAALAARGVPIREEAEREMRRMSSAPGAPELLVLEGPAAPGNLEGLMAGEGLVLLLVGLRYPANAGFLLRCAEVAGVAGIVLANDWGDAQLEEARRVGMRADRFMPLVRAEAEEAVELARRSGRRVIAIETDGARAPWHARLEGDLLAIVGSETEGIPAALLDCVDETLCIPMAGFIPSYNVQAAVGIFLGEWLRQNEKGPRGWAS